MTAVQWISKILDGQKDQPFNYDEWQVTIEHALKLEEDQIADAFYRGAVGITEAKEALSKMTFNPTNT